MKSTKVLCLLCATALLSNYALAGDKLFNPIPMAMPIMNVAPDARAAGMGDMGVATSPDVFSQYWNAAKYPFTTSVMGIGLSVTPWLANLVQDVRINYGSMYYQIDERIGAVSLGVRHFSLGSMEIRDVYGEKITDVKPSEFSIDAAFSRKFGTNFAAAVTLRYVRSDLTGGYMDDSRGNSLSPANGFGVDMATYYQRDHGNNTWGLGLTIANLGSKISYAEGSEKYFMPASIHLGGRYTFNIDADNSLMLGIELSKLLVPTPPVLYDSTESGGKTFIRDGKKYRGMNDRVGAIMGMIQSFYDAPYGAREELSEIMFGGGLEYSYRKMFNLRAGYFHDSKRKGNRRFLTFGAGIKYSVVALDLSYLYAFQNQDPLSNTLRITLSFDLNIIQRLRRDPANRN